MVQLELSDKVFLESIVLLFLGHVRLLIPFCIRFFILLGSHKTNRLALLLVPVLRYARSGLGDEHGLVLVDEDSVEVFELDFVDNLLLFQFVDSPLDQEAIQILSSL